MTFLLAPMIAPGPTGLDAFSLYWYLLEEEAQAWAKADLECATTAASRRGDVDRRTAA
jgi:hypothetical protein